jgi:hypothetical protein
VGLREPTGDVLHGLGELLHDRPRLFVVGVLLRSVLRGRLGLNFRVLGGGLVGLERAAVGRIIGPRSARDGARQSEDQPDEKDRFHPFNVVPSPSGATPLFRARRELERARSRLGPSRVRRGGQLRLRARPSRGRTRRVSPSGTGLRCLARGWTRPRRLRAIVHAGETPLLFVSHPRARKVRDRAPDGTGAPASPPRAGRG